MFRRKHRRPLCSRGLSIAYAVILLLILESPFGVLARPQDTDPYPYHRRRAIEDGSAYHLQETLQSFKQLQNQLGEHVLLLDDDSEKTRRPKFSYEIEPLQRNDRSEVMNDWSSATTLPSHKHRHRNLEERQLESGNSEREWPWDSQSEGFRLTVNANLHNTKRTMSGSMSADLEEEAQADSFSERKPRRRRKRCPRLHNRDRFVCPSRSRRGYHVCIDSTQLCNRIPDCPGEEDENPTHCLFYKSTMGHFKHVVDTVVSLAEHMVKKDAKDRRRREL